MVASYFLRLGWGWAFIAPGLIMVAMAIMVFFWLVVEPADVDYASPYDSSVSSCALVLWHQKCMHTGCRLPVGRCDCSGLSISEGVASWPILCCQAQQLPGACDPCMR